MRTRFWMQRVALIALMVAAAVLMVVVAARADDRPPTRWDVWVSIDADTCTGTVTRSGQNLAVIVDDQTVAALNEPGDAWSVEGPAAFTVVAFAIAEPSVVVGERTFKVPGGCDTTTTAPPTTTEPPTTTTAPPTTTTTEPPDTTKPPQTTTTTTEPPATTSTTESPCGEFMPCDTTTTTQPPATTMPTGTGNLIPGCESVDLWVSDTAGDWEFAAYPMEMKPVTLIEDSGGTSALVNLDPGEYRLVLVVDGVTVVDGFDTVAPCDEPEDEIVTVVTGDNPDELPATGFQLDEALAAGMMMLLAGAGGVLLELAMRRREDTV